MGVGEPDRSSAKECAGDQSQPPVARPQADQLGCAVKGDWDQKQRVDLQAQWAYTVTEQAIDQTGQQHRSVNGQISLAEGQFVADNLIADESPALQQPEAGIHAIADQRRHVVHGLVAEQKIRSIG